MIKIFLGAVLAAAISCPVDAQQRNRATGPVIFYAGPNGSDTNNDCLSLQTPCTPQGAHSAAKLDWDFAHGSCLIQLADGTYTAPVSIAGQYVGTHLCDLQGKVDSDSNCADRGAVAFHVPHGNIAFTVQDGMIASISCITVTGGGIGFHGRQFVVLDLVDIDCGHVSLCLSGVLNTVVNTLGEIWISGDQDTFASASLGSIFLLNAQIVVKEPVKVTNLILSEHKSHIELSGKPIVNPDFLTDSACIARKMGTISKNGTVLPCREDGKSVSQQGNGGMIYD
jgi:hypothetical protein